ncbi:hypothetical protein Fmac_023719 [Flemingia macrophylla]|uniref:Sugar phosphate transporter domain-containing protein n=1 Tax=Flemingia macrophylla TaxID=520843 RepID=A0ABD1LMC8_9FABA
MGAVAWVFNVVTSVGIIIVNKALMATYGFSFATTLTGLHFATTALMTAILRMLGYIQASRLPLSELLKFVLFANFSIVGMNVSLMWNSVGFYQIAKLSMIPVSCLLEVAFDKVRYSRYKTEHSVEHFSATIWMVIAVIGMIWYGNASSKPGGKERLNHSLPTNKTENI